ncbi:MAG TPA: TRAM domain-containing protein, partial [Mycobacteriales bacterium]
MTVRRRPAGRRTRQRATGSGPLVGYELELEVGPVAHGGHCVARYDGRVIFVRHALPGERVIAKVTEDTGGSYARADAVRVLEPSPDRVAPACAHAGPGRCGGCDFQHVSPDAQRRLKAAVVREQLARIAGTTDVAVTVEELPGGPLGWRTRVQFAVDVDGRVGLRRHRSRQVEP